jgi:hypothetical protein
MSENAWREENCTNVEPLYCTCPFPNPICPGHWDCPTITEITDNVMDYYDTNGDLAINELDSNL